MKGKSASGSKPASVTSGILLARRLVARVVRDLISEEGWVVGKRADDGSRKSEMGPCWGEMMGSSGMG